MTKASDNLYPGIIIRESANDGSDFSNPSPDYRRLFLGEDGQLHVKDSAGTVTDIGTGGGGAVATDSIWDAAGDLAVGSGANTAAKLAIGATNGMALRRVSGAVAWDLPPGHELDYTEFTSPVSVTGANEAGATTIVTAGAVTFDGSTVAIVEFYAPVATPESVAAKTLSLFLFDGSSGIGTIGQVTAVASQTHRVPVLVRRRLTPSAASHTYSIRGSVTTNPGTVTVGAGGTGNYMPGYIRIVKA